MQTFALILVVVVVLVLLIHYVFSHLKHPLNIVFSVAATLLACWMLLAAVGVLPRPA